MGLRWTQHNARENVLYHLNCLPYSPARGLHPDDHKKDHYDRHSLYNYHRLLYEHQLIYSSPYYTSPGTVRHPWGVHPGGCGLLFLPCIPPIHLFLWRHLRGVKGYINIGLFGFTLIGGTISFKNCQRLYGRKGSGLLYHFVCLQFTRGHVLFTTIKTGRVTRIFRGTRRKRVRRLYRICNFICGRFGGVLQNKGCRSSTRKRTLGGDRYGVTYSKQRIGGGVVGLTPTGVHPGLLGGTTCGKSTPGGQQIFVHRRRICTRSFCSTFNGVKRRTFVILRNFTIRPGKFERKETNSIYVRGTSLGPHFYTNENGRTYRGTFSRTTFTTCGPSGVFCV